MRTCRLFLLLACFFSLPAFAQGDADTGKTKAYTCTGCHGIEGYNNVYPTYKVPRIGGQNAAYLESALRAYAEGNRPHPTMRAQAQSLSAQDVADISAWLANIEREQGDAGPSEPPSASQVCQACHGSDGLGTDPAYPVLAGQHASYLVKALEDYRSGARRNAIMGGFASQLTDQDIHTLAQWYASRPGLKDLSGQ